MVSAADLPLPEGVTVTDPQAAAAYGIVEDYCGWSLEAGSFTATLDSDGGSVLVLPSLSVSAVHSLVLNGTDTYGNPWPALTASVDWDWRSNGVLTRLGGFCWPTGGQLVTVSYEGGYSPLPDGVLAVIGSVAQRVAAQASLQSQLENVGGVQQSWTYGQSVTAGAGLTAIEAAVLNRHRIATVA